MARVVTPPLRRLARGVGVAVTALLTLLFTVTAALVLIFHLTVHPVLSASMRPAYGPGSAIVTKPVPLSALRPGMIVLFKPPGHTASFAHRIVTVSGSRNDPVITTKGDANPAPDPWRVQLTSKTVPRVVFAVPLAGYVMVHLRSDLLILLMGITGISIALIGTKAILGQAQEESRAHSTASEIEHTFAAL